MKCGLVLATSLLLCGTPVAAQTDAQEPRLLRISAEDDRRFLHVAADGSAPFRTIQAAIDSAPIGGVVRVAPGDYPGPIRITRAVTLEGGGWDKTRIATEWRSFHDLFDEDINVPQQSRLRFQDLLKRAVEVEKGEGPAAMTLWNEFGSKSALTIENAEGVVIRGLRFSMLGRIQDGGWMGFPMVKVEDSHVMFKDCAFAGSAVNGLEISGDSTEVECRDCLVAGIRASGVRVSVDAPSRVLIADCDVRNCGYAGLSVGGSGSIRIEGCRISNIQYHGVKYGSGTPEIVRNAFLNIRRGGIYATGETRAVIRNNLFLGCGYWGSEPRTTSATRSRTITFVHRQPHPSAVQSSHAAVWISAQQNPPVLRRNVISDYEHGVAFTTALPITLQANVFDTSEGALLSRERSAPPTSRFSDRALPQSLEDVQETTQQDVDADGAAASAPDRDRPNKDIAPRRPNGRKSLCRRATGGSTSASPISSVSTSGSPPS